MKLVLRRLSYWLTLSWIEADRFAWHTVNKVQIGWIDVQLFWLNWKLRNHVKNAENTTLPSMLECDHSDSEPKPRANAGDA